MYALAAGGYACAGCVPAEVAATVIAYEKGRSS